jgi:two-component system, chemotaxis family, sensor kinase CheA
MDPMEQIKATFFLECEELLADLEAGLLALETGEGDGETINAVFRAVHSVKGGAGAFGLEALVRFAHVFETTLDGMRSGRIAASPEDIKVMLRAADVLSDLVAAAKTADVAAEARIAVRAEELAGLLSMIESGEGATEPAPVPAASPVAVLDDMDGLDFTPVQFAFDAAEEELPTERSWIIHFRPARALYEKANDCLPLLRELARLGDCQVELDESGLAPLEAMEAEEAYLAWTITLTTSMDRSAIEEVFEFVDGDCDLSIDLIDAGEAEAGAEDIDVMALIRAASEAAPEIGALAASAPAAVAAPAIVSAAPATLSEAAPAEASGATAAVASPTIRVDLERVDRLINLVGELVINQAMLAQRVTEEGLARSSTVAVGLEELEQLTREIQDSVMAIRAQPVKSVFQRMPRLVREVASMTGKQARLVTEGEGTEVDKTVIERLTDPITHMIRNAIDHGLEGPSERVAAGKPAQGTVRLSAQHRSGRIVIEVSDDGKGINRARVRDIAINKGLIDPAALLSDEEVDNLIFMPGFSTAETVSDVSGRGVGMDVVKRSIQALGGRISIVSRPGEGSTFTLSLPLTLAVLDGMVVSSGDQTLVAPLTSVIETLQPKPEQVRNLGASGLVLAVRDTFVPLIDVAEALGFRSRMADATTGVALLVESGLGGRAALLVDDIQGQRQVVIKSLEANYQQVEGVAAATILGDGRVALILDIESVIALTRKAPKAEPVPLKAAS